jgi:hypothetical protein
MDEATLTQINQSIRRPAYALVVGLIATLFALLIACAPIALQSLVNLPVSPVLLAIILYALALLIEALGILRAWMLHRRETLQRSFILHYDLDEAARSRFCEVQNACRALAEANRVWQVVQNRPERDWKCSAGVSVPVKRRPVKVGVICLPYLITGMEIYCIDAGKARFYFMPGELLIYARGRYSGFPYDGLGVRALPAHYLEDGKVPADAKVVGQTWQFVRRDGQPARHFGLNRRLQVVSYGLVELTASTGWELRLHVSNLLAARQFARLLPIRGPRQLPPSLLATAPGAGKHAARSRHSWLRRLEGGPSRGAA